MDTTDADSLRQLVESLNKRRKTLMIIGGLCLIPVAIFAQLRGSESTILDYVLIATFLASCVLFSVAWRTTKQWIAAREQLQRMQH